MTFPMVPHMHSWYYRNVRNNASKMHQKSSFWELTVTVCGGKETQTHPRNIYFKLSLRFFKNVKELGRYFDIWTIDLYVIFHDVNTSGVDYTEMCGGGHSSL